MVKQMKYSQIKLRLSSHLQGKVHYSLDVRDDTSRGTCHEGGAKNFGRLARGGQKHYTYYIYCLGGRKVLDLTNFYKACENIF